MKRPNIKYCRELRREETKSEHLIWIYLKNRQLKNIKFRRQFSLGTYILDFYAPSIKLAIEIDGGQHYEDSGEQKDKIRTEFLNDQGVKVIRFSNNDVIENLDGVYLLIENEVEKMSPSSNLLPKGEKGTLE